MKAEWYCTVFTGSSDRNVTLVRKGIDTMEENKEVTNGDLVKFLQQMQVNADKISNEIRREIKTSKENLEKLIRRGNEQVKEELNVMNDKINEVKEDMEKMKTDNGAKFGRMEGRMKKFEEEKENIDIRKRERELLDGNNEIETVEEIIVEEVATGGARPEKSQIQP